MKSDGFTLLEVLATIIVSALLSVILVQAIGRYPGRSHHALQNIKKSLAIESALENISAQYEYLMRSNAAPLVTLQSSIHSNSFIGDDLSTKSFWGSADGISGLATCLDSLDAEENNDDHENNCTAAHHYLKVTLESTESDSQPVISIFTR